MKRLFFILIALNLLVSILITGCVNKQIRFPASTDEIFSFKELKQDLVMAAQNNILFHIPNETLSAFEKKEVDSQCKSEESPFWTEKLSVILNTFRRHPEWFQKFHVLEIKKADVAQVLIEKDLDGASVLSIQFVKSESRGQINFKTNLPCNQNRVAEYLGKDLIHTQYEFPAMSLISNLLSQAADRKKIDRFNFNNQFLTYLAERGFILKYNHEISFNRVAKNEFVLVKLLNQYSQEILNLQFVQLWMKIVNQFNQKENIVQFFSFDNNNDLKMGVSSVSSERSGQMGLFSSFKIMNNELISTSLNSLDNCLSKISIEKTNNFLRQPATEATSVDMEINGLQCSGLNN